MEGQRQAVAEQPSEEALAHWHPGAWIEKYARILTKEREFKRPVLNIFQARVVAAYCWCLVNGIAPRIIGLKPRQVGGTTIFAALCYHHGRRFNSKGIAIADVLAKSDNLFRMMCDFARYDEYDWGFGYYPPTRTELRLKNGTEFVKRSADTPTTSRSDTLQIVHSSETAYWKDTTIKSAKDVAVAILNALAKHKQTFACMESTPDGAMGLFFEQWEAARWPEFDDYWKAYSIQPEGAGNGWIRVFAGWHEFEEHRESVRTGKEITEEQRREVMASLDDDEKNGMELYGWDVDQILWRRWTIANNCLGERERFLEEYPTDPETAFLTSGRPRFDTAGITALHTRSRSIAPECGLLSDQHGAIGWQSCSPNEGFLYVWERPRVGCKYLISADTMTGESETLRGDDSDCHSVLVWRKGYRNHDGVWMEPREVARIIPPSKEDNKPLAEKIALLSRWFGGCIVIVETNMGHGLITHLRDMSVPLYRMVAYDKVKQMPVSSLGWQTNEDRRRDIIDTLASRIREQTIDIADPHLIGELKSFIRIQSGRSEAMSGRHDDDVLSAAIGLANLDAATEYQEQIVEARLPEDWDRWKIEG